MLDLTNRLIPHLSLSNFEFSIDNNTYDSGELIVLSEDWKEQNITEI